MKTNSTYVATFILLLLVSMQLIMPQQAEACDWCNNKFFMELNTTRKGTFASDELLRSIHAQHDFSQPMAATSGNFVRDAYENIASFGTSAEAVQILSRDARIPTRPTGFVPQNTPPTKRVRITLQEGSVYLGNGVVYEGFTINNTIPGPDVVVQEGDIVEFTVVNEGNIPHGASIHSAYTQTSKYLGKIAAKDSATVVFRVNHPGVYMYHCAPGGHAIPMHVIMGQYGMMVVEPRQKYRLEEELGRGPDIEINITQHEIYASGKDAVTGQGQPLYTMFNGRLFRYVEEPIMGRPGDYVRVNFLNVGPNLVSTFHIVGIIWDYAYWQGDPKNILYGGQTVTAGPSDSWTIEFRIPPDEGAYTILTHAVGSASRGAIGLLMAEDGVERTPSVAAQGPVYTREEMQDFRDRALRVVNSAGIGSPEIDVPRVYPDGTDEVIVQIIGNSYYPKIIDIKPGTKVTWVNEDVFSYMEGEFSGVHNVITTNAPQVVASPLLAHAETFSFTFTETGVYEYMCAPHPYMRGEVRVSEAGKGSIVRTGMSTVPPYLHYVSIIALALALFGVITGTASLIRPNPNQKD
jgi:nitrite reductase (NO-forming)